MVCSTRTQITLGGKIVYESVALLVDKSSVSLDRRCEIGLLLHQNLSRVVCKLEIAECSDDLSPWRIVLQAFLPARDRTSEDTSSGT